MSGDEITLRMPRDEEFKQVAQFVLGGVAARANLSYESFDDLAIALESLLERAGLEGDVTVTLHVEESAIRATVGPYAGSRLATELERTGADDFGLRRVLDTVVDGVEVADRDDGQWIELTKRVHVEQGGR